MRTLLAGILSLALLLGVGTPTTHADEIPPYPTAPERKTPREPQVRYGGVPLYSVVAGILAVALTGSLIALRWIRLKSSESEISDAGDAAARHDRD